MNPLGLPPRSQRLRYPLIKVPFKGPLIDPFEGTVIDPFKGTLIDPFKGTLRDPFKGTRGVSGPLGLPPRSQTEDPASTRSWRGTFGTPPV